MKFTRPVFPEKLQGGERRKAPRGPGLDMLMGHHCKTPLLCPPPSWAHCIDLVAESSHSLRLALPLSPLYRGGS